MVVPLVFEVDEVVPVVVVELLENGESMHLAILINLTGVD